MYWNQELLGEWFYILLQLSCSNQYALFSLLLHVLFKGNDTQKGMVAFLYFPILDDIKLIKDSQP